MKRAALLAGLSSLAAALWLAALVTGPAPLSPGAALAAAAGAGAPLDTIIVQEIRLPRALLAALIGASLGLSGAVLQGLLRNPLAEPGVTGVSAAAGLGAVLALYTGLAAATPLALPGLAMAGALAATLVVHLLSARETGVLTVILAGAAVSSLAGALTALTLNLAPNPYAMAEMTFWLMGSLKDRSLADVALAAPFMAAGMALLLLCGRGLDALALGEDAAASLGVDLRRLRLIAISGTTLCVGAGVAVAGAVGFVGLVVPHLVRMIAGPQPSRLLLPSALGGAALVLAADLAVRAMPAAWSELMLGVVTALIGAPFFLYLLLTLNRRLA